jgi:hypothetical protein
MSLNKTLDRLFDEIRREAKRNPDFADRLDAVLRLHESRRDVPDGVIEEVALAEATTRRASRKAKPPTAAPPAPQPPDKVAAASGAALNPIGLYQREGEEALAAALAEHELTALRALVLEHNLDPSGVTAGQDRDALAAHIVAQAKRRAERDDKMFDY